MLSVEGYFCLSGQVNTHNCRNWAGENPHAIQEQTLHQEKWQYFTAIFIIGLYYWNPYLFRLRQRYHDMRIDFIITQLQQRGCLSDITFTLDDAPPHIDRRLKSLLSHHFIDARVISRYFPTSWPPYSADITLWNFWFWDFLKDNIYRQKLASVTNLKDSIRHSSRLLAVSCGS